MELTDSLKCILRDTAKQLKGSARRIFMARIVKELRPGGASRAEHELGWDRKALRKGTHELGSGIICLDAFGARGRKVAEEHLPNLGSPYFRYRWRILPIKLTREASIDED